MKINEIGGEFELIRQITRSCKNHPGVLCGIGDDCAVLCTREDLSPDNASGEPTYLLVTTDMMVENDHFSFKWFTPEQVGKKCIESNVSDILAMGGRPCYAFLSMSLKKDTDVDVIKKFYNGLYKSADRHKVLLLGGDTTHGTEYVFNLTLIGKVPASLLRLRSKAEVGDLICVTGDLGGSTAGLKLLLHNKTGYTEDYLEPKSRTWKEADIIAHYATAMIDVSDGLGSEITHICQASCTGAEIIHKKIPVSKNTVKSAKGIGDDPYEYALYGGEDYEIVFTIPVRSIEKLKKKFSNFTIVGKIVHPSEGIHIIKEGKKNPVLKGYDHFI